MIRSPDTSWRNFSNVTDMVKFCTFFHLFLHNELLTCPTSEESVLFKIMHILVSLFFPFTTLPMGDGVFFRCQTFNYNGSSPYSLSNQFPPYFPPSLFHSLPLRNPFPPLDHDRKRNFLLGVGGIDDISIVSASSMITFFWRGKIIFWIFIPLNLLFVKLFSHFQKWLINSKTAPDRVLSDISTFPIIRILYSGGWTSLT